jgi:hypothetical protein
MKERGRPKIMKKKMTSRTTYYYILYVDVVDSSKNELELNHQIFKLNAFNMILREILHPSITYDFTKKWDTAYNASTGDGAVFCFGDPTDPFVLSIMLHTQLQVIMKTCLMIWRRYKLE